jgi:hypothetical protein
MDETFIVLTKEQADAVRGKTSQWTALDPVPLADGVTFVLPARVLSDPYHESKYTALAGKTVREVTEKEWASLTDIEA